MLKQRLISAAVLLALAVYAVLTLSNAQLAVAFAIVALAGAWEWSALIGIRILAGRLFYVALLAGVLGLLWQIQDADGIMPMVLSLAVLWWLAVFLRLLAYSAHPSPRSARPVLQAFAGLFVLVPAWAALVVLHAHAYHGAHLLLFFFALIWLADSSAYFVGRRFGKTRLAPHISPGKTRAGVYGSLLATLPVALAGGIWLGIPARLLAPFVLLSVVTVVFSIIGDLYESMIKRQSGAKDSGRLLPGHGGVLDRIDSLTAAAPIFLSGLRWLQP